MSELSDNPNLKEINAYKKKLNWGDVPAIYHLAATSISDVDGILTHGFDSAFKQLLDRSNWNPDITSSKQNIVDTLTLASKPKISLFHNITEQNYELHCYPIINQERVLDTQINNPACPFIKWSPETMQMLFRLNSLVPFIVYTFQKGDKADYALVRYAHSCVDELISLLEQSFDIIDIKGYSIAEFCKEIHQKHSDA
jgi:hypothetical protein